MAEPAPDRPDMLAAALEYARQGWPVFPVSAVDKQPLVGPPPGGAKGSGGLHRATTDEVPIRQWWGHEFPGAMIAMPTGPKTGVFVVDLDAGVDEKTGEIFEAAQLLANLEAELGGEQAWSTLVVETPRGGRHIYFPWPAEDNVRNRQGIVHRVDVRGDGGYVILPPSQRPDGRAYAWLGDRRSIPRPAPAALLDLILRRGRWARGGENAGSDTRPRRDVDEALRKYALAALDREARALAGTAEGQRNGAINEAAFALGGLVGAGVLSQAIARATLRDVVGAWPNRRKSEQTIESGLRAGIANPRDLSGIGDKAGDRRRQAPPPEERPEFQVIDGGAKAKGTGGRTRPRLRKIAPTDQLELRDVLRAQRRRFDPPPLQTRNGVRPGLWSEDELGLPVEDPCPVLPLGIEGRHYHFLDSAGQYTAIAGSTLNHAAIQDLFATSPNWVEWAWPRYGKPRTIKNADGSTTELIPIESFKDDQVRKALFQACARKGLFSPEHRLRGRGAWKLRDGALYYHAGEDIWIVDGQTLRALEPGIVYDGETELIFPSMRSLPAPWPKPVPAAENPARELLAGFRSWNWERPDVDPILLLGWIGVAFLGGALDWRSAVFLIGDKGTGKSTLQGILKNIFGDALLDSANTTAAGIYQALAHDARPVAVDEIEAGTDNRKVQAVIELARQASSGAFGRRGASDSRSQGIEFQMRSAFLFSAINNPPLAPQDLSRIAVLRLRELDPAAIGPPPPIDIDTCGRKVLARLMLEWHRFPATFRAYREALAGGGHSGRGQDTYGTLLAAADMIVGGELAEELGLPLGEDLSAWSELLHVSTLPEVGDALANWHACINHSMQSRVEAWRAGARATIGQLIEDLRSDDNDLNFNQAKRLLADAGLGLVYTKKYGLLLAVPNSSPQVERLFYGSRWQGVPGIGGWSEALRQAPDGIVIRDREFNRVTINNVQQRCMMVALERLNDAAPAPFTVDGDPPMPR